MSSSVVQLERELLSDLARRITAVMSMVPKWKINRQATANVGSLQMKLIAKDGWVDKIQARLSSAWKTC